MACELRRRLAGTDFDVVGIHAERPRIDRYNAEVMVTQQLAAQHGSETNYEAYFLKNTQNVLNGILLLISCCSCVSSTQPTFVTSAI